MLAMLEGEQTAVHKPGYAMGWELFGKRAIRLGNWKIIYRPYMKVFEPLPKGVKTDTWQLYNLAQDPAELHDLSKKYPDKLKELVDLWKQYASHNHVIIPNDAGEY
jgi:arylsulfatase